MPQIILDDLVKIYPYAQTGLFASKRKKELLEQQKSAPYTTNEGVVAVQHFSLTVEQGDFTVLLGPSGCGKTTVLRMIAGLEEPTLGKVLFDGKNMEGVSPEERNAAMVFQNYSLYPHLNVYDNIAFPLRNAHVLRSELEERVASAAELLKLTGKLKRLPSELSGGERQRVALARSLVRKPGIFLMDEPFSNLDAPLRASLRAAVKEMHRSTGASFVYVTHDRLEALSLATKLVVIQDGIIRQQGRPAALYNSPADLYTAQFLALPSLNVFRELKVSGGCVRLFGLQIPVRGAGENAALTAGVRPSDIILGSGEAEASVKYSEPSGSDFLVRLDYNGSEILALQPASSSPASYPRGSRVRFGVSPAKVLLFDKDGRAI